MGEIPNPVADDAPNPRNYEPGDTVRATRNGLIAVDHDGQRYCLECANPEYVELCRENPRAIPFGGPVRVRTEVDCPGHACGNCLRRIEGQLLIHGPQCEH